VHYQQTTAVMPNTFVSQTHTLCHTTTCFSTQMTAQEKAVLKLLQSDSVPPPDVQLLFDDVSSKEDSKKLTRPSLPVHSFILSVWSSVLRGALEMGKTAADDGNKNDGTTNTSAAAVSTDRIDGRTVLPLLGTTYEQWLQVAPFLYPVTPLPLVSWLNIHGVRGHAAPRVIMQKVTCVRLYTHVL
jgi:hypothetical protein